MVECEEPEFWDRRYRSGDSPWELARLPQHLARWIAAQPRPGAVLIPGCGSGREVAAFVEAGWAVTGIDFAAAAIARARAHPAANAARLIEGDFFAAPFAAGEFDLVYERTFLTALPPARWPACAARYQDLLQLGGRVVGYFCYGYEPDPPPYFQPPEQPPVLSAAFELAEDTGSEDALPFFGERERWQVWKKPGQG